MKSLCDAASARAEFRPVVRQQRRVREGKARAAAAVVREPCLNPTHIAAELPGEGEKRGWLTLRDLIPIF